MMKKKVIISWVLILAIVFGTSLFDIKVKAYDPPEQEKNKVYELYEWHKAKSLDDLPQKDNKDWVPILIVSGDNTFVVADFDSLTGWPWPWMDTTELSEMYQLPSSRTSDRFYTRGNMNPIWIKYDGRETPKDNCYCKVANSSRRGEGQLNKYMVAGSKSDGTVADKILAYEDGISDSVKKVDPNDKNSDLIKSWKVTTQSETSDQFHFFVETTFTDCCFQFQGLGSSEFKVGRWDWDDDDTYFSIYIGEKVDTKKLTSDLFDANNNSDQMQELTGIYMVDPGKKVVIPEGAVVMVSGAIINEGTIENHGVIIINTNGQLFPMDTKEGFLKNIGGDVIVLKDGLLRASGGFSMEKGTFINKGVSIISGRIELKDSIIQNDANCYWGYQRKNNYYYQKESFMIQASKYEDKNIETAPSSTSVQGTKFIGSKKSKINSDLKGLQ